MTSLPRPRPRRGVARPSPTRPHSDLTPHRGEQKPAPTGGGGTEPLLYTAEQAAELLQVRPSWLRRKATARAVPCRFVGKHLRFSRDDITAIAETAATPPRQSRRTLRG
jgi:excisionase family DNA binding protein